MGGKWYGEKVKIEAAGQVTDLDYPVSEMATCPGITTKSLQRPVIRPARLLSYPGLLQMILSG